MRDLFDKAPYAGSDQQRADDRTLANPDATSAERDAALNRRRAAADTASKATDSGPTDVIGLAAAILAKSPLSEAQAKLYAALHIATNAVQYGARHVDAVLVDLLDPRVKNDPYVVPNTSATPVGAPADELAQMRQQLADLEARFAHTQDRPAPDGHVDTAQPPFTHGAGN